MSCPPQYTMPAGSILVGKIVFQNTGTTAHDFDVALFVGHGTKPQDWRGVWNYVKDVHLDPGQSNEGQPTEVHVGPLDESWKGTWDVMAVIADITYNAATNQYEFTIYDYLVCYNALVVS